MDFSKFIAGRDDNDRRIDKVIRIFCPKINLSSIYKFIRKGLIKVNNKKISADYRVLEGDEILIADFIINQEDFSSDATDYSDSTTKQANFSKNNPEIKIIFQNQDLLAINKPYDFVVHGESSDKSKSIEEIIRKSYKNPNKSLAFTPGPLHRLDKKTTGILFFSQSLEGARWFSENLRNHRIQKKYIGIVQGKLLKKQIWIDEISKVKENSEKNKSGNFHTVSIKKTDNSKTAETEATPLCYGKFNGTEITVVQYFIKTGRTHQIRSQSAVHGFPLLGDTAYGGKKIENSTRDFYLHAQKIIFLNVMDVDNFPKEINCPLDKDFSIFITKTCGKIDLEL